MRKFLLFFLVIGCCWFSASAWAGCNLLIKIDETDQATVELIRKTEIEVWAKTGNFWLAAAGEENLELLVREGIAFHILDQEADFGEYYLVWAAPPESMSLRLQTIKAGYRLLFADENVALVKGDPRKIEKLASLGFDLRKINKRPLPLERGTHIFSCLPSLSLEYEPLIDSIVGRVDRTQIFSWVDELTGEETVPIGGVEDTIKTRYSWSDGVFKAACYIKERFGEMGLPSEFDTFQVDAPVAYLQDIACSPGGQKAWSVSIGGGIIKTTTGGDHWSLVEGTDDLTLWEVCRIDDDTLWSVGRKGTIIRSTDGGNNWENKSKPELGGLDFRGSYFEDAAHGWVVGDETVLFTSDGGANWIEQTQAVGVEFYGIDFVDALRGWAVGRKGTILRTADRGTNWSPQTSGTSICLKDVDFVDILNGWAVGEDGWAIFTTNGGLSWNRRILPTSSDLNGIDFVDSLHGWMVGFDGSIFYTSDLGVNWAPQPSGSYYLCGIDFADSLTGWATGYHDVLKTSDGGGSWFSQYDHLEYPHLVNVVGTIKGLCHPGRQFLITGHYDDVSEDPFSWAPGADDNASGVVSVLTAASILKDYALANTVKFVAFAGEEQGLLGSAAYAQKASDRGDTILGVINCDMIAYDGNDDAVMEVHSGLPPESQALADIFIHAISDYGLGLIPEKITDGASHSSDHASFWDYGFPAVLAHEDYQDWNPYMHSTQDRVSAFDSAYCVHLVKAAVATLAILSGPFVFGDATGDGLLTPSDVVYLVNYLYRAGAVPEPPQAGDANCNGIVDAGDVVYLIGYLFRGGPPPGC